MIKHIEVHNNQSTRIFSQGVGQCSAQYGELFQGQVANADRDHRCLVSLPCKQLASTVRFSPCPHTALDVWPIHKHKSKAAVELMLDYCGERSMGGAIRIESNIPEAKGCGSSTADCVAAVMATAAAFTVTLNEEDIARLVVQAEVASDNLMFNRAVLFAHREGIILKDYRRVVPELEVLGIDTADNVFIDTLEFPPAVYSAKQLARFAEMTKALDRAMEDGDIGLLGEVATESACINQAFLPKPMFVEIRRIVEYAGALGIAVAHSGTVLAILLDPQIKTLETQVEQIKTELDKIGVRKILRYRT